MPYKSKEEQREKRREEVIRIKQNRVIEGYVFHNHPEIYKKAKALYIELDALYPGKNDLRRTQEYQQAIGKGTGKDKYKYKYLKRYTATPQNQEETVQATNSPVVPANSPVVPVIPYEETVQATNSPVVPANTPDTLPLLPDEVINNIVEELMKDPEINTFFENFDTGFQETDTLCDPIDMEINEGLTPLEKELM